MVERTDWCGCRTLYDAPPPVVEGEPYVEQPLVVRDFASCGRHADWIDALAESHAYNCGIIRLDREGIEALRYYRDDRGIVFVVREVPDGLSDRLNATEPSQDWRNPGVPDEHQERFHALVVAHLLACRLASILGVTDGPEGPATPG